MKRFKITASNNRIYFISSNYFIDAQNKWAETYGLPFSAEQ